MQSGIENAPKSCAQSQGACRITKQMMLDAAA
jgi:hypothetical protein